MPMITPIQARGWPRVSWMVVVVVRLFDHCRRCYRVLRLDRPDVVHGGGGDGGGYDGDDVGEVGHLRVGGWGWTRMSMTLRRGVVVERNPARKTNIEVVASLQSVREMARRDEGHVGAHRCWMAHHAL